MVNRWDFAAITFLLLFSAFLINLVFQDVIDLFSVLGKTQSQLKYLDAANGIYDPAMVSFRGFKLGAVSVALHSLCVCSLRRTRDPAYVQNCTGTPYPINTNMVGIGNNTQQPYWDNFYEIPGDRGNGEYLYYVCTHPGIEGLTIATTPFGAGMARFFEAAAMGQQYIDQFYQTHFINRPLPYNPSGHYNTILLEKRIYLGIGEVADEVKLKQIGSRCSIFNISGIRLLADPKGPPLYYFEISLFG